MTREVYMCARCHAIRGSTGPCDCSPGMLQQWIPGEATFHPDSKTPLTSRPAPKPSCDKVGYATEPAAESAKKHYLRFKNRPKLLRSYWCDECRQWHLSSKPQIEESK